MLNALKMETNVAYTQNGAKSYKTTQSKVLDFFAQAGAMRQSREYDIISLFTKAFGEDRLLAVKALFYFRDIRQGQGERQIFRMIMSYLATHYPDVVLRNLHLISEYGRWDDLYVLFFTPLENQVGQLIKTQLMFDLKSEHPSLLAKWLKSENASSFNTKLLAAKTRKMLGLSPKKYRQILSTLRKRIDLLETKVTNGQFNQIDYSKLPSQAGLKYRKVFLNKDNERYSSFISSVNKGERKINTSTIYPYQLVEKAPLGGDFIYNQGRALMEEEVLNAMWSNLPDYLNGSTENAIAVVDTSGSMFSGNFSSARPIHVALSLGLYMAERNKGHFHNHFISFNTNPELIELQGSTFCERVKHMSDTRWGGSTNVQRVFELLLNTALKHNVHPDEMIKKVYIISDMQFNCCSGGNDIRIFDHLRNRYMAHGYELPQLVFWNVDAKSEAFPVKMTDTGVQLVSGFSPTIFTQLLKNMGAYELMLEMLNSERYEAISV